MGTTTAALNTSTPLSGTYAADPVHSSFGFAVRYQGVSLFRGTLDEVQADASPTAGSRAPRRSSRSRSGRPSSSAPTSSAPSSSTPPTTPRSRFVSTDARPRATTAPPSVTGDLTIKGITKPVAATGTWTAPAADAFGNARGHLNLEAVIDRTEWDMNWNMPLPSGGNALANDVTLTVELSLVDAGLARCGSSASPAACAADPTTAGCSGRRAPRSRPESTSWSGTGLAGLPAFDEDLESRPPEPVRAFLDAIAGADALLIATPEYNASLPGALKNALDWASRPFPTNVLR